MMGTILCIEDEGELREDLVDELRQAGYNVKEAADGVAGLSMATDEGVCLVLCDVRLPGLDGIELMKRLRSKRDQSSLAVIFLTAFNDPEMLHTLAGLGAHDVFVKPVDYDELLASVARVQVGFP